MPSQSVSIELSVFKILQAYQKKHKFQSYTETIADLLKSA